MGFTNYAKFPRSAYLLQLILFLPAGVFLAEVVAMIIVYFYRGPYQYTILLDATITMILVFPMIFFLSYQPMLNHIIELERAESVMHVRLHLMEFSSTHNVDAVLQETLDNIQSLTDSTIGFFHFLDADQKLISLQAWSTNTLQNMCKAEGKGSHYDIAQAGVWADCIRQRQPVVHNNYATLPNRKGLPEGHASVVREMAVPILREEKVVAILGIGNKPKKFNNNDVELVSKIADFAWDIIERKQAEITQRDSEEKFRTLLDWTYDWEIWLDPKGAIMYSSPSCERITGFHVQDFMMDTDLLKRIVHPDDLASYLQHLNSVHAEPADSSYVEYRLIDSDGNEHWIEHICRPIFSTDNYYMGRRVSNRDITLRKLAEMEIKERNENEIMLTQMLHNLQIDVARDLHDTIGQNLSYLRMKLDHLSETDCNTLENLDAEIKNMLDVADESHDLVRGTLTVLQSGGLTDLLALFVQYASQIEERSPCKITVSSLGEPKPLTSSQVRQLFFVFREALSNAEKYAQASQIFVELDWMENDLALLIQDNGTGFDMENTQRRDHYGLKFMQERTKILKGSFSIESKIGGGTRILVQVPLVEKSVVSSH